MASWTWLVFQIKQHEIAIAAAHAILNLQQMGKSPVKPAMLLHTGALEL